MLTADVPVHVCVSLSSERAQHDLLRLDFALRSLVGVDGVNAQDVIRAALRLAPGLAIQCVGATGIIHLGGLLGLLLSASTFAHDIKEEEPLILALDQHRELLEKGGQLSDLLAIWFDGKSVKIRVAEAKFSTNPIAVPSKLLEGARNQIDSTIRRLAPLALNHPLKVRVRSKLARAIIHRFHLGFPASGQRSADRVSRLVQAVLDPSVHVEVQPRQLCEIHAWSVSGDTKDVHSRAENGVDLAIRGRDSTLAALRNLGDV